MSTAKRRSQIAQSKRRHIAAGSDIAIKAYKVSKRRASCKNDLKLFCQTYLKHCFPLPPSPDQLESLDRIQHAALVGGSFASSAPRGDGKTTRALAGLLWITLYGHSRFTVALAATADMGKRLLRELIQELSDNDLLAKDWPEICKPIRKAFGKPNAAKYLTINGEQVRLELTTGKLVFPTWSQAPVQLGGTVIMATGLLSAVRGLRHTTPNGETLRPDFALLDDIQTRKSANSIQQVNQRLAILTGDIKRLAGPDKELRAVANLTVIARNDAADQLLDNKAHPEWRGTRKRMLVRFPDNKDLWETYKEHRRQGLLDGDGGRNANEFYIANREAMDKGAIVSWEHRFRPSLGEVSAVQCCFNILSDDGEESFWAECQNEPIAHRSTIFEINPAIVASRLNGLAANEVPKNSQCVTAFVDINPSVGLYWSVVAWDKDMTGSVLNYGAYPAEGRAIWSEKNPKGETEEQCIYRLLVELSEQLTRPGAFMRDGKPVPLDLLLVDQGYKPAVVFQFAQSVRLTASVVPSSGRPGKSFRYGKSIRNGDHWAVFEWDKGRVLVHDADFHRMNMQQAFLLPVGSPGGLTLFGDKPLIHGKYSQQVVAEKLSEYIRGDVTDHYDWHQTPGIRNDWGDSLVGARVAASYFLILAGLMQASIRKQDVTVQPAEATKPAEQPSQPPPVSYAPGWGRGRW